MKITKVWIEEGCTACGLCEDISFEVFKVESEATINDGVDYTDYEMQIRQAAESCPVEVIKYSEQ